MYEAEHDEVGAHNITRAHKFIAEMTNHNSCVDYSLESERYPWKDGATFEEVGASFGTKKRKASKGLLEHASLRKGKTLAEYEAIAYPNRINYGELWAELKQQSN